MKRTSQPGRKNLRAVFEKTGIPLAQGQVDLLWRYYLLIDARNPEYDLTRIRGLRNVAVKHFLDCAIVPSLVTLPSPLLDIGSGAGFPGIVLKILLPEHRIILAEPRYKRIAFLREVISELSLTDVEIYPHRIIEEREVPHVAAMITRALETISATLVRVRTHLPAGGSVYFMKGPAVDSELPAAMRDLQSDYDFQEDIAYILPGTSYRRRLIVCRKR